MIKILKYDLRYREDIVATWTENADDQDFLIFPYSFSKVASLWIVKNRDCMLHRV